MSTIPVGSIDPPMAADTLKVAEFPRIVAETAPDTLGARPSFAQSNRPLGAAEPETEQPLAPDVHFGNTPMAPTLSLDSARKTCGSKAFPPVEGPSQGDQLPIMAPPVTSAAYLPPASAGAGVIIAPTQMQTLFLEPTQLQETAIDASNGPGSLPASGAAVPAPTLLPTQLLQATQVHLQVAEQEESQKRPRITGIIPETDEDNYTTNSNGNHPSLPEIFVEREKKSETQKKDSNLIPTTAPAPAAAEVSTAADYTLELAELEMQLRERWLASYPASEEPLSMLQCTAMNAATEPPSQRGSFAEAIELVLEWNVKMAEGNELYGLRTKVLYELYEETAKFLFGPVDANKLSEMDRSHWIWSFAEFFLRKEKEYKSDVYLERLSFTVEEDADDGDDADQLDDMDEAEASEFKAFLCTKEEVAKREAELSAGEATDKEYVLQAEKAHPRGLAFTNEELLAKAQVVMQKIAAAKAKAAAVAVAADEILRRQVQEQEQQQRPETETEAGIAPAAGIAIENDGPDALDVGATHPSNNQVEQEKEEEKQETVAKKNGCKGGGNATAAAAGDGDGPHELQVDLTAPPQDSRIHSEKQDVPVPCSDKQLDNHGSDNVEIKSAAEIPQTGINLGWMAGGWSKVLPGGSLPNTAASPVPGVALGTHIPASADQNTPSGMFQNRDAPDGGVGVIDGGVNAGLVVNSMVPETQSEQLKPFQQGQTEGMDSVVRPAAPGAVLNIPAVVAVAATAPTGTGTESDTEGSQPVGTQKLQDALRGVGLLADEMEAASQPEAENPSGPLKLFGKDAAGGAASNGGDAGGAKGTGGFAVPAPRKSSRLGPAGSAKAPEVEKETTDKQPQPQQQQQQQQQQPQRRLSGSKLVAKKIERRAAYLDKVMEKSRPDLGVGGTVRIVKAPAPISNTRKQPERQQNGQKQQQQRQQQQQHAPANEAMPARRTSLRHILLSGLHDTADCYEMDGTDSTALNDGTAVNERPKDDVIGLPFHSVDDQNQSDPFNFPSDVAAPNKTSPAPLKVPPRRSPRKSPRRPATTSTAVVDKKAGPKAPPPPTTATAAESAPPRQPYQPAPIVQNIGGLILTRLPHPMLQTAPECSMEFEVSIAEGVVDVQAAQDQTQTRRVSPRKRKQDIVEKEVGAAGAATGPRSKRQKTSKDIANDAEEAGPSRGRRRQAATTPEPADSEDQTIKERWLSTGGKRKQRAADKTTPIDTAAVDKEAGMASPRRKRAAAEVAEKKLQSSSGGKRQKSERPPGVTTGCPKCRYSKTGCAKCDEAKAKAKAERDAKKNSNGTAAAAQKYSPKKALAAIAAAPPASNRRRLSALVPPVPATRTKQVEVSTLNISTNKAATITASGPLHGMCFLVSGSGDAAEGKGAIEELILSLSGRVLADIPVPTAASATTAGQSTINRRLSVDLRSPSALPQVDAVIADRNARRAKCIYAAIKGLPVVSPDWLKACKRGKKRAPWTGKYQLLAAATPAPAPVFAGLRVHLKVTGKKSRGQSITQLMQHAGAQMTGVPKESTKDYETSCDLVIIDDDVSPEVRVPLERLARRLRIPCHTRDWAIRAMMEGTLPDDFAAPNSAKQQRTPGGRKRPAVAAAVAPSPEAEPQMDVQGDESVEEDEEKELDVVPEPSPSVEFGEEQAEVVEAAVAEVEDHATTAVETAAVRRSRRNNADSAPEDEVPLPPARRRKSFAKAIPAPVPPPAAATGTTATATAASPEPSSFKWIGEPIAPPQGSTPAGRRYYDSVIYNNEKIQVGSHVELSSMPGESAPRVAQVAALWAERDVNGQDKPFGRFIRLLRPDDTSLALAFLYSQKQQVFMSTVEEPRLSLKGIERKCIVAFPSCADELTHATQEGNGQAAADYVCMAQYDLQDGVLMPLPQQ